MFKLNNIITLGYRCTTDSLLEKYNIRSFSGPFSYLIVDFKTALILINTNFKDYFKNIKKYENNELVMYLPHWRMTKLYYVNKTFSEDLDKYKYIYNANNILLWNHHTILNKNTQNTFKRRQKRILELLEIKKGVNSNTLLFYIDKIYEFSDIDQYISNILKIIKENYFYNKKIIYVIPFINDNYISFDTKLYFENEILKIFLIKTTKLSDLELETKIQNKEDTPLLDTDIYDKNIKWYDLLVNINNLLNP